jgi:tetratricopeptide (TPR) repeat protein
MRRVLLILAIVTVLGLIAGGLIWYLHRNTTEKLLARSELALRAQQYDRATELADSVIVKEPDNWRGYYMKAQALSSKGQYAEARQTLEEAAKHNPPGVAVPLAVADTYARPARRALSSEAEIRQTAIVVEALAGLQQANDYLGQVHAADEAGRIDVQQAVGLNLAQMAAAQQFLRDRLEKESQVAAAARDAAGKAAKHQAAQNAEAESDRLYRQAIDALAAVVTQDPTRPLAARMLVDLCVERNDQKTLAAARQAIFSVENPVPAATVQLVRAELRSMAESADPAEEATRLASATDRLDRILQKAPTDADAKLTRAEIAVRSNDLDRALELCNQVVDSKPDTDQRRRARFLRARVLAAKNAWTDAEKELYALRTEAPRWAAAQYFYGRAAHETGKGELAREAMRAVTEIERLSAWPDPVYAEAHRFLAESLMADGFTTEAFSEAKAFYNNIVSDPDAVQTPIFPVALRLYVQLAKATDQPALAKVALETALKEQPSRPDVMLVVYEGYRYLGEQSETARRALEKAADSTPATLSGRLDVARAKVLLGRVSDAEQMLTAEAAKNPRDARVIHELGWFLAVTGRPLQAIEQYREAVRLEDRNLTYHRTLATALHESGLDDDCLAECRTIQDRSATDATAIRLVNLIRLARGQDLLPSSGPGALTGSALAQALLASGRPQQCADVCLEQLKKTPDDMDSRLLLGQAYKMLGRNEACVEQWTAVLKQAPDRLRIYLQLADTLGAAMKPEEVETSLAAIPGAKPDLVNIAVGWLFDHRGQYEAAAEAYGRLASRQGAPEDARNLARFFRAQSLARAGHIDQATIELDQVAGTPGSRSQALYYKATLLSSANRSKEADAILGDLLVQAAKDKDMAALERIATLYGRMKQTDKALAVCDQMEKVLPNDARSCLMRAEIMTAADRLKDSIDCYRQAIERQPGNPRSYVALARTLDAVAQPLEALATLRQLEGLGQTGRQEALFAQGALLARWGLQAQAVEAFDKLAELGRDSDPRLQLGLGQAFAILGRKDQARKALGAITEYAPGYVTAQQILASLEDTDDARLGVLRQARKIKPDSLPLLAQQINTLVQANRAAEAVSLYQEALTGRPAGMPFSDDVRNAALRAMFTSDDWAEAAALTARAAQNTTDPRWRQAAILLALVQKPDSAKAMLPAVGATGPYEALLGLLAASQTGQPLDPWVQRLDQIQLSLSQMNPPQSLAPSHKILAALVAGSSAKAEAEAALVPTAGAVGRQPVDEFIASFKRNPKLSQEAAELLKASLAVEFGMPQPGRAWAMQILKARPACQWAAVLVLQTRPDTATAQQIAQVLQPADCILARMLQARLATEQKQYDKAVELYQAAVTQDKNNPELTLNLALALEQAGHPTEALALYRQVWEATHNPIASNNGAYIITRLYPKDQARLAEAQKSAQEAVKAAPNMPGLRDTLGWIDFLMGRNEEALLALRQAVRDLPDSPEVHYHLALAETQADHKDLAQWHFAATVSLVDKLKADGQTLSAAAMDAADQARQALTALPQPKP